MPVEADVVTYLAAQGSLSLTAGTNVFEGPLPEAPATDPCVAVSHYVSQMSDEYVMGPSLSAPGYEYERIQVMVRSATKATAQTLADSIHAFLDNLHTTANFAGSGRTYFHIRSDGPPFNIFQDTERRWRFVANYEVRKARG